MQLTRIKQFAFDSNLQDGAFFEPVNNMKNSNSGRTDIPILILSILAVVVAGALSMATITSRSSRTDRNDVSGLSIPSEMADEAAKAGLEAAKWHIECHGRTASGSIGPHFYVNGATYSAQWDDMNLKDSTVNVQSTGSYLVSRNQNYQVSLQSKIKIEFLPAHKNIVMTSYYSEKRINLSDSLSQ